MLVGRIMKMRMRAFTSDNCEMVSSQLHSLHPKCDVASEECISVGFSEKGFFNYHQFHLLQNLLFMISKKLSKLMLSQNASSCSVLLVTKIVAGLCAFSSMLTELPLWSPRILRPSPLI